ncbi:HAD family hydrolase [Profundibacter sp.]|uniref:HAD family hydrolase n=1 Tax=Profundibacter sp. TaxID=3101071 RepID=UPI003D152D93
MGQVKAVIYDIGQVLIEWNPERFYDGTIGLDRRKALFAAVDLYGVNAQVDRGAPFRDSFYALAEKHPEYGAEIRMWHDRWLDMASPEIPWSVRLLRSIRAKGVPVFALSNFGIEPFETAMLHYPFFNEFDQKYVSGYLRMMKPDNDIYAALETGCRLPPETLLFTDDRPENIETATKRGWRVHLFEGPDGWARALVDHGVLTRQEAEL